MGFMELELLKTYDKWFDYLATMYSNLMFEIASQYQKIYMKMDTVHWTIIIIMEFIHI